MATTVVRGPLKILLQTSAGQYVVLGMGAWALFPEQFGKLLQYSPTAVKALLGDVGGKENSNNNQSQAPIIIHTPSPTVIGANNTKSSLISTLSYAAAGAGACWAGYIVCVQLLPESLGQFLPVTRTIFDKTTQALGKGILQCKKVLEEKILILTTKSDELAKKQDDTQKTVSHIKSELGEARIDLSMLQSSMDRCEESLESSQGMQQYTLRGVRLLVRCVANMIQDSSGDTSAELERYIQENEERLQLPPRTPQSTIAALPADDSIPIASAVTPAITSKTRLFSTPSTSRITNPAAKSTSFIRKPPSKDDSDSPLSDIKALLGH